MGSEMCIRDSISSIDEEAAVTAFNPDETQRLAKGPIRPGESHADSSGYAIGAGLVQMEADLGGFNLLCTFSAGLTVTQMQQHPSEQELWSQLMATRAWRKIVGRYPWLCWTDHQRLVRLCMLALDRIDPKHSRWFQEISESGSELSSLAGRSMVLGDGFSRNPEHRDALLRMLDARNGDLKQMKIVIKGFDLDEHQSAEPWDKQFWPPQGKEVTADWPGLPGPDVEFPPLKNKSAGPTASETKTAVAA